MRGSSPLTRGEHIPLVFLCALWWGSSPLTRGKRRHNPATTAIVGLIPAHAGKTTCQTCSTSDPAAHPRSRGENWSITAMTAFAPGSSPLMRGKPHRDRVLGHEGGLILARAVKTCVARCARGGRRAHPHSREEHMLSRFFTKSHTGSSPPTRRKHLRRYPVVLRGGLIPAHAGKTASQLPPSRDTWAHPRSRGENLIGVAADLSAQGSSPLTRGKQPAASGRMGASGLIPTHAGKTGLLVSTANHRGAHPRSHGGKR